MKRHLIYLFSFLMLVPVVSSSRAYGQACGCAGSPLLVSLENPYTPAGSWDFGLKYEYNEII
ncbi:hypothetical protein ACFL6P_08025 [Candidatus Latescibacterota bacterium]